MRYCDAAHVDVGGFYARNVRAGKYYRLFGYVGMVAALVCGDNRVCIAGLLAMLVLCWLAAWWQVAGTLWRSSLVAACLLCAARLTLLSGCCGVTP